jgi:hypothetical protein
VIPAKFTSSTAQAFRYTLACTVKGHCPFSVK